MLKRDNPLRKFGCLLKYDLLSSGRLLLPLYAALIIVSIFGALVNTKTLLHENVGVFSVLSSLAYGSLILALCIVNFVFIISRFKKNLLGREGYLSFSLPVGINNHILAKLVLSLICEIICFVIILLATDILFFKDHIIQEAFKNLDILNIKINFYTILYYFAAFIILSCKMILSLFFVISLGNLFTKYRVVLTILLFIGLSIVESRVDTLLEKGNLLSLDSWIFLLIQFVWACLYYVGTYLVLSKKLNLD